MKERATRFVLRPDPDGSEHVLFDELVSGASETRDNDEIIAALAASSIGPFLRHESTTSPWIADEGLRHWDQRNWGIALDYYLRSRLAIRPSNPERAGLPSKSTAPGIVLADPTPLPTECIGETIFRRAAAQELRERQMSQGVLASILGHGLAGARTADYDHESPWTDAITPIVVTYDVEGVPSGWYWCEDGRKLVPGARIGLERLRGVMRRAMVGQAAAATGAVTILLVLDVALYQQMLPVERGLREAYIDAGRLAHYYVLCATAHQLRTHQSPAVRDSLAVEFFGLDPVSQHIVYTLSFG